MLKLTTSLTLSFSLTNIEKFGSTVQEMELCLDTSNSHQLQNILVQTVPTWIIFQSEWVKILIAVWANQRFIIDWVHWVIWRSKFGAEISIDIRRGQIVIKEISSRKQFWAKCEKICSQVAGSLLQKGWNVRD